MKKGWLVLENGQSFEGFRFGAEADTVGELVFTTGVVGYVETLTDPSCAGQIVMQTYPLIGNYGVMRDDCEGVCAARGYVVREYCDAPSNFRTDCDLDAFLKERGVPALCGLDTRELTRIIRNRGVMNALICDAPPVDLSDVHAYRISDAVRSVTCDAPSVHPADGERQFRVALFDYGVKRSVIRALQSQGCEVTVLPASASADDALKLRPDGVFLSNGPGDPADNVWEIEQIRKLLGKLPIFGICLGHQMLALAAGGQTYKLKYGHRGANQPAREVGAENPRTYITSENSGYAVDAESVGAGRASFVNVNDGTCEGMEYPDFGAFGVQFYPDASGGPGDTKFLFDKFASLMRGGASAEKRDGGAGIGTLFNAKGGER